MPTRASAPVGAPCWIDLLTSDTERSRTFYSQLFGWAAEAPSEEFGGYFMFTREGVPVAGGMPKQPGFDMPDEWGVYLAVADARAAAEAASAAGGQVRMPVVDVADLGSQAVLADPGGARIGIWQARTFPGLTVLGEPGAPAWFELHTREYTASVAFYRDVFGWDAQVMSDTPEMRYTTLGQGETAAAGIMDASELLPAGAPAEWSVYFWVDDVDATLSTVSELGGSVVQPAEDTPYGRLAGATDPTGAGFRLLAANAAMPAR